MSVFNKISLKHLIAPVATESKIVWVTLTLDHWSASNKDHQHMSLQNRPYSHQTSHKHSRLNSYVFLGQRAKVRGIFCKCMLLRYTPLFVSHASLEKFQSYYPLFKVSTLLLIWSPCMLKQLLSNNIYECLSTRSDKCSVCRIVINEPCGCRPTWARLWAQHAAYWGNKTRNCHSPAADCTEICTALQSACCIDIMHRCALFPNLINTWMHILCWKSEFMDFISKEWKSRQ